MQYEFAGSDLTFGVPLDPPADAASVKWTLRDNTGTPISSQTNQTVANSAGATSANITTLAAGNTIGSGLTTETRFLVVTWASNGDTIQSTTIYVLANFMPLRTQVADVRTVFSLNEAELDDAEIDLVYAALSVSQDITPTVFNAALTAGDITTLLVNAMVAYKAAMALAPSLPTRLAQSMSAETTRFARLRSLTVDQVVTMLREEYDRLRTALTNPTYLTPTIFAGSVRRRDPVRGPLRLLPTGEYILEPLTIWLGDGYARFE